MGKNEVVRTRLGGRTYLTPIEPSLQGEWVASLRRAIDECVAARELDVVVDLERVQGLLGTTLEGLLDLLDHLEGLGGSLSVKNASPLLREIFLVTGFDDYVAQIR